MVPRSERGTRQYSQTHLALRQFQGLRPGTEGIETGPSQLLPERGAQVWGPGCTLASQSHEAGRRKRWHGPEEREEKLETTKMGLLVIRKLILPVVRGKVGAR